MASYKAHHIDQESLHQIDGGFPEQYGEYITKEQLELVMLSASEKIGSLVEQLFSFSIAGLPSILAVGVYVLLVPVLVFFFLIDKVIILDALSKVLPAQNVLSTCLLYTSDAADE